MGLDEVPFSELIAEVVDNRGRSCPTANFGIPLIATNCIRNELLYPTYEKARYVSEETYSTWFRGHPIPGDILFVNKATPGRVCLVPDPVDFCIAQDMVAVRANSARVYPKYLFAVLRSPIVQERIAQMHVGTLIPHFKKGDFDKLLIPLPDPADQVFIGDLYLALSAKIELNRRMNETLEAMARALFKSWFVDFDPVRTKAEGRWRRGESLPGLPAHLYDLFPDAFQDSELGEIPKGWTTRGFGDIADLRRDQQNPLDSPRTVFRHFSIPAFDEGQWPKSEMGEAIRSLKFRVPAGVVLLSKLNPRIDRVWLVDVSAKDHAVCSTEFLVMEPRRTGTRSFVYCLARSRAFRDSLAGLATGTSGSHQRAQVESILGIAIVEPGPSIVDAFCQVAEAHLERALACRRESRTLAALRDALLPKLISGELRVKGTERFTEKASA